MKKALMLASVASMIDQFNMDNINILQQQGYHVDVVTNFENGSTTTKERVDQIRELLESKGVNTIHMPIPRKISDINGIIDSYRNVKKICNENKYQIIHCHSPIGSVVARLAARNSRKTGTRVIYTAHGFHFFKGAPLKNWIMFYPIEWICSFITDVLITINHEDYDRACRKLHAKAVKYIPGVGIDTQKIINTKVDRDKMRESLGIPADAVVVLSVGEMNDNKNHVTIVKAIAEISNKNLYYVICGIEKPGNGVRQTAKELGIEDRVMLAGYRRDVIQIAKSCDIFAFPSKREGLGLAALEAMAAGLPIVTSNVHGIVDYSVNGATGYTCSPYDVHGFAYNIKKLAVDSALRRKMGEENRKRAIAYDIKNVKAIMEKIYGEF